MFSGVNISFVDFVNDRAELAFRAGLHYIVSGSFKSAALYLLAFDPIQRSLNVVSTIDAYGPHQYLATNADRTHIYATTWASPPILSSFAVEPALPGQAQPPSIKHLNNVDIPATSSYVSIVGNRLYSAGGHYAEVHEILPNGAIGSKTQQLEYLPSAQMANADRTRKALRVGAHGFDLDPSGKAYVPHLGTNSIWIYEADKLRAGNQLHLVREVTSPRPHDGPRHVWPSPNGKLLYSVTEHTNFIDVYEIRGNTLKHKQSGQIVPKHLDSSKYRGNTLRLSRDGRFIFGSTRGSTPDINGYVAAFELDGAGWLQSTDPVAYHEMPASGGIAGAIEPALFKGSEGIHGQDYILLVDEQVGFVSVLGWSGFERQFTEVAKTRLPDEASASHALWLS